MSNTKFFVISFLLVFCTSCKCEKTIQKKEKEKNTYDLKDESYVLYSDFEIGDCRRYGVFPDSLNNAIHPYTGISKIQSLVRLSEEMGITIFFPKGYYGANILLDSKRDVSFRFNNAEFNLLRITNEKGPQSSNISLKGTLILYDRFGTYNSNTIEVDSIFIKTNKSKHLSHLRSRGCHIYKGTSNLTIKYLEIQDLGSGKDGYKNNHASLAIDGLWNNPKNVSIEEVLIKSSDRHGAYITGFGHKFKKITIEKYAQGTTEHMTGMQDSQKGEEKILSGIWINRCNDCEFEEVIVNSAESNKGYLLKLDEGRADQPTFINKLILDIPYRDTIILDNIHTNILVKELLWQSQNND